MKASALRPRGEGVVVGWGAVVALTVTLESRLSVSVAVARSWSAVEALANIDRAALP